MGDYVVKSSHDDPHLAVVIDVATDGTITGVYEGSRGDEVPPSEVQAYCEADDASTYEYTAEELEFTALHNHW